MKNFLFIFCLHILSFSFAQDINSAKKEALNFALEIVKSYFTENCDFFYNSFSNELISLEDQESFDRSELGNYDEICDFFKRAIKDKNKTFQDYLDAYSTEILTYEELVKYIKKELDNEIPPNPLIEKDDLIFVGWKLKNTDVENFIFDDMFVFILRKENNKWVIKGA